MKKISIKRTKPESSSTSILVTQRNEEDTENDTEIEEIPFKKARKASRVYNHHADFETYNQALDMIKNKFECYSWTAKEKQKSTIGDKEFLQSFNYEFPISMAQSINQDPLSNENDNDQDQAESINNDIQTIVQPTTSSNLAPRKRGHPRKNP